VVKWLHLTQNQYIGFFALGLVFLALQQLPYIIMPLLKLDGGVLMAMTDKSAALKGVASAGTHRRLYSALLA
jgi:hypothetical protein